MLIPFDNSMDISRMSHYGPRERVFVNNKRRSNSVNCIKTNNNLELNKNYIQQNLKNASLHTIKHDSNYLLGSSIVNVNFVNNVSNPNRGYEEYRNIPILNTCLYHKNNFPNHKYNSINNDPPTIKSINNYENGFPFENYTYYRSSPESYKHTIKKNLNVEDKIITSGSNKDRGVHLYDRNKDNSTPILTRNYITNSSTDLNRDDKKLNDEGLKSTNHPDEINVSNKNDRKTKLGEYLQKVKSINERVDNSQKKVKITAGKPKYEFIAKYPDPVEKELERWHNSHNSTLKWERVRHGLYSVGGSMVHLVKTNGNLYVEGHGFKKYKGQISIHKFVEEKESRLLKEKI